MLFFELVHTFKILIICECFKIGEYGGKTQYDRGHFY